MKILLIVVGKTDKGYLEEGIDLYLQRLKHYTALEVKVIPELKNTRALTEQQQKEREGEQILQAAEDCEMWLLDENGKEFSSEKFAAFLDKKNQTLTKIMSFVIGGPYGFSEEVYAKAMGKIALSQMTFSHQMVRLFFVEQLYRALTIIKGEPYHNK
ncbi:MAG: 23S rRNA (pseudouridine(1915)-N(3))-methyltransferase RlmH [Prevotellaceae bacterium]|jgi:23S rRNA (pseudouridine1915-N3)-methyltransferase|nr:23S rRNA (pseudouridine(1915)-N(3))-methyltransferase RlmH [Prevotellaceae bacterium]